MENNKRFREIVKEKNLIATNLAIVYWDLETRTPRKGQELLSKLNSKLHMQEYNLLTSEEFVKIVQEMNANKNKLNEIEKKEIEISMEEIERMKSIPADEFEEYSRIIALNQGIWEEAKSKNDFSIIKEGLESVFYYNKKFAEYRKKNNEKLYDVLLNDYEKGMTVEKLDNFFAELKKEIVPLLEKIQSKKNEYENILNIPVDENIQMNFAKYISKYLGFDYERGVLDKSEHPFTLNINKNDVRITTKNLKNFPFSTIFSTIHETGHAIYEQQIADELLDTLLGSGGTMGLHESQSRFMENVIGRSEAFWQPIYKKAQEFYPFLKDIEFEVFYKAINSVKAGLIRVESDELTYSLHIMLRYELEKMLIADEISVSDLPKLWNKKMEEYLHIIPENDAAGFMQDVHWYCGSVGYFPSYAIGNAYSVQIFNAMKKDFDVDAALRNGELYKITEWLKEKIHKYGKLKDTPEIIKAITGEDLNPKYYIEYLKEKYSKIYDL